MVKFSRIFLLLGSICLVNPVLAVDIDDDDDGDYSAAPIVYKARISKQQKQLAKKAAKPVSQPATELLEVDDDDDGDYSDAPVVYKYKTSTKQKQNAKVKKKAKSYAKDKPVSKKLVSAKAVKAREKWNSRSDIDPFE